MKELLNVISDIVCIGGLAYGFENVIANINNCIYSIRYSKKLTEAREKFGFSEEITDKELRIIMKKILRDEVMKATVGILFMIILTIFL